MRKISLLIFILVVSAALSLQAQVLDDAGTSNFLKQLSAARGGKTFQAEFDEVKTLPMLQKPIRESGTISFLPPDLFRRELTSPARNLTVCDGETLWLYYPEFQEVEKYSLAKNKALRDSLSAMTSGLRLNNLEQVFSISVAKIPEGHRVELSPRSGALKKILSKLTLTIAPNFTPRTMEILGAEGDRTVTTFSAERPATLSASDFRFQPPKGVTVSEPLAR